MSIGDKWYAICFLIVIFVMACLNFILYLNVKDDFELKGIIPYIVNRNILDEEGIYPTNSPRAITLTKSEVYESINEKGTNFATTATVLKQIALGTVDSDLRPELAMGSNRASLRSNSNLKVDSLNSEYWDSALLKNAVVGHILPETVAPTKLNLSLRADSLNTGYWDRDSLKSAVVDQVSSATVAPAKLLPDLAATNSEPGSTPVLPKTPMTVNSIGNFSGNEENEANEITLSPVPLSPLPLPPSPFIEPVLLPNSYEYENMLGNEFNLSRQPSNLGLTSRSRSDGKQRSNSKEHFKIHSVPKVVEDEATSIQKLPNVYDNKKNGSTPSLHSSTKSNSSNNVKVPSIVAKFEKITGSESNTNGSIAKISGKEGVKGISKALKRTNIIRRKSVSRKMSRTGRTNAILNTRNKRGKSRPVHLSSESNKVTIADVNPFILKDKHHQILIEGPKSPDSDDDGFETEKSSEKVETSGIKDETKPLPMFRNVPEYNESKCIIRPKSLTVLPSDTNIAPNNSEASLSKLEISIKSKQITDFPNSQSFTAQEETKANLDVKPRPKSIAVLSTYELDQLITLPNIPPSFVNLIGNSMEAIENKNINKSKSIINTSNDSVTTKGESSETTTYRTNKCIDGEAIQAIQLESENQAMLTDNQVTPTVEEVIHNPAIRRNRYLVTDTFNQTPESDIVSDKSMIEKFDQDVQKESDEKVKQAEVLLTSSQIEHDPDFDKSNSTDEIVPHLDLKDKIKFNTQLEPNPNQLERTRKNDLNRSKPKSKLSLDITRYTELNPPALSPTCNTTKVTTDDVNPLSSLNQPNPPTTTLKDPKVPLPVDFLSTNLTQPPTLILAYSTTKVSEVEVIPLVVKNNMPFLKPVGVAPTPLKVFTTTMVQVEDAVKPKLTLTKKKSVDLIKKVQYEIKQQEQLKGIKDSTDKLNCNLKNQPSTFTTTSVFKDLAVVPVLIIKKDADALNSIKGYKPVQNGELVDVENKVDNGETTDMGNQSDADSDDVPIALLNSARSSVILNSTSFIGTSELASIGSQVIIGSVPKTKSPIQQASELPSFTSYGTDMRKAKSQIPKRITDDCRDEVETTELKRRGSLPYNLNAKEGEFDTISSKNMVQPSLINNLKVKKKNKKVRGSLITIPKLP